MKGSTGQLLGYSVAWGTVALWNDGCRIQHLDDLVRRGDQHVYLDDDLLYFLGSHGSILSPWVPCNILWGHTPSFVNS